MSSASESEPGCGAHHFLGLDIGSVNARLAVVDVAGQQCWADCERIYTGPAAAVAALFDRASGQVDLAALGGAGVCGSGRGLYAGQAGWLTFSSPFSAIAGLLADSADARTIVAIGGQSAFVVGLQGGLGQPWHVARSPLCAAGTGRFLEQQASRLGIPIEEFGPKSLEWQEAPPRIAARCSVFAKSDLIHLQQKGWPVAAMLAGLSDSVARMILAQWRDTFQPAVYLLGGVALNSGVRRALAEALGGPSVLVPSDPAGREALGAALLARSAKAAPSALRPERMGEGEVFHVARSLAASASPDGWRPRELDNRGGLVDVYVGVDVGSTSTKAAVVTPEGEVLAKHYLMTAGQPLEAVKQVMAALAPQVDGKVRVRGAGVTGSGRYLVGNFIGADLIKNEITAQTRAALLIDSAVDTVFELGGQDSKYVYLENGTVLDYQMNKACAAGTGSFIDELAEQLGVSTRTGEFARLAFSAPSQLDLGERCAAFMSQAVTSAQHGGVGLDVIAASLAVSLAKNYRSKVVGTSRVGKRVFLTGAVFYNQACVSAFQAEFPDRTFIVPVHKEVTGAIGAALLAKESLPEDNVSPFRGFTAIAEAGYKLSNFTCHHCENSCAISLMTTDDSRRLYYGSRCDRYDAAGGTGIKPTTPFSEREALLFADYDPGKGAGVSVGVPRALMTFDLAPLLLSFLNELGVEVSLSAGTNKQSIERSLEHAYTDSCFPLKLLHGHVAELLSHGVDFVLVPNAIRMGRKGGEEDQRYSCPLIQAAPYIIRSAFSLGDRVLDPIIDLSRGDEVWLDSCAAIAKRLGFDQARGRAAGRKALLRQQQFEEQLAEAGRRLLAELAADPQKIGVVLLSRAYNAQDAGANLGMAQELAKLGVVPIPLDYLPLASVDVGAISDRPYWNYERKLLAAAKLIAENPQLFGLFLSNFGCGPNSIIQNIVEDMMGAKPLGQIEVDEHAAEAGYVTRIEALVDTLRGYRRAGLAYGAQPADYARRVPTVIRAGETMLIPPMADHAAAVVAAMRAFGVQAELLPESDERSLALSRDVTSGKECLPFRDSLGVLLRAASDGALPKGARTLMAGSFGPCRLGKYAQEQQKILDELGIELTVLTTVSNNAYADLGLGTAFELLAWQGVVAVDQLQRLLWLTRPYERQKGETERVYRHYLDVIVGAVAARRPFAGHLREATAALLALRDPAPPRRPLVGINGEIYLRANRFCNKDLVGLCEANGLEVEVAPMSEWMKYVSLRNLEDGWQNRDLGRTLRGGLRKLAMDYFDGRVFGWCREALPEPEPSTRDLLDASAEYLPSRNGSEAVLSLGSGLRQMRNPHFAGVISVMPHGCMPGGIVAALAEQVSKRYGHKPWISLTFDGFADRVNPERVADLAEQVRQR
ncbi:MAG: acyl-CoA dehydratase activase [Chloroflexi bacterium]|nr:acyl-CoA dehydratase activase [Chloroflexota bacterium]MCL5109134.1 acyl-CoA dehydratase activase [Chloroflexota bacterium]